MPIRVMYYHRVLSRFKYCKWYITVIGIITRRCVIKHIMLLYFFKKGTSTQMPKVSWSQVRRRRRLSRPKCLCLRSLSSSIHDASDFRYVFCSSACKRPHYLHAECAQFYCTVVRRCGFCRQKFVQKSLPEQNLLEAIIKRRKSI